MLRLAIIAGMTLLLSVSCNKNADVEPVTAGDSISATVSTISYKTAPAYLEVAGTVEGRLVVPVATKLMSQITFMGFEEGQRVVKGDLLAVIDDADITAMRSEAAAFRAEASGVLGEVEAAINQGAAAKEQALAGLAQAIAVSNDATVDAKRFRRLVSEDVVAPMQAKKYEMAAEVAAENVTLAEAGVVAAQAGIAQAKARIPQVEAKQDQAAAKDAQAVALQNYANLTAPFDGVVTARLAEPGQMAIPGQPLYKLADDSGFIVVAFVAEDIAAFLEPGQVVEVSYIAGDGVKALLTATILVVSGSANPSTHTVRIEVGLDRQPGLFSGKFVRVQIPTGQQEIMQIPASALVREGSLTYVWRVSEAGRASTTPVDIGATANGQVEVIRGLSEGDRIVVDPPGGIYPGIAVQSGSSPEGL